MNQSKNHTAVIVFTRSAEKEAEYKNFSSQKSLRFNKNILKGLINKTIALARQTNLPVYVVDEKLQHGKSFGEILSNSIEDHFAKGYENLIVIGNDCIGLTKNHLLRTLHLLQNNGTVAGPTTNGGLYLIGISRSSFDKNSFINLRWQTEYIFSDFIKVFPAFTISQSGDANNEHELKQQLQLLGANNKLLQHIQSCFASFVSFFLRFTEYIKTLTLLHCIGLRAPPVIPLYL